MAFSIVGTSIYTFGRSLMLINIGRFVMGLGWGIDGAIVGKVALLKSDGKLLQLYRGGLITVASRRTSAVAHLPAISVVQ